MVNSMFAKLRQSLTLGRAVDKKPITLEAKGTSGTEMYAGMFDEETLSKLYAEKGIAIFDEMRRGDGQVKMLLSVVKNPIKSASWTVEAAEEDNEEEQEIAEFVRHILFDDIQTKNGKRKTFMDFLSEALTCIEFGFSAFEVVHKVVKGHKRFGDYLGLADLGFRHQRSIMEWILEQDGTINHVRQLVNGDLAVEATIPGQHLLVFSIDKEGDNYPGISMLRPCYGPWFRKNVYRKIQAIGIERAAKGVPIGTIPADQIKRDDYAAQLSNFQGVLDQLTSHQKNGIVLGAGFDIKELKISHDADKVQSTINGEDNEMASAFVANFIMLGRSGNSGSFALGTDLSAIFLGGIQNIGYSICEKINLQLIQPLVRAKYGDRDKYPTLCVSGIADKAGAVWAETITKLISAGAVQKSATLQRHTHKLLDLPDIDEEQADREAENAQAAADALKAGAADPEDDPEKPKPGKGDKKKLHSDCQHAIRLTAEQKAAHPVSAFIEARADTLTQIMRSGLHARALTMLNDMGAIIRKGGDETTVRKAVLKVTMPDSKEYIDRLKQWAGATAKEATDAALAELGKSRRGFKFMSDDEFRKLLLKTREKLVQLILLTAGYQAADFEKAVYFSFNEAYGRMDERDVLSAMSTAAARQIEKKTIETAAVNVSSKVTNTVRRDVFFAPGVLDEVESFVFLNPDPETAICQSLVGTVFSKDEYQGSPNIPPLHHNCKSYIAAQTIGAAGNRPLTAGGLTITDEKLLKQKTL